MADHVRGAVGVAWVGSWLWAGVVPGVLVVLLWFPTGDVPGRQWRWAVRGAVVASLGIWVSVAFAPGRMTDYQTHVDNPLGWTSSRLTLDVASKIGFGTLGLVAIATLASVVVRFQRGNAAARAQLRWLLIAVLVFSVSFVLPNPGWLGVTTSSSTSPLRSCCR